MTVKYVGYWNIFKTTILSSYCNKNYYTALYLDIVLCRHIRHSHNSNHANLIPNHYPTIQYLQNTSKSYHYSMFHPREIFRSTTWTKGKIWKYFVTTLFHSVYMLITWLVLHAIIWNEIFIVQCSNFGKVITVILMHYWHKLWNHNLITWSIFNNNMYICNR